jgi:hypothetical protein
MDDVRHRFGWPSGWELVTRDGRRFCTCDGGCYRTDQYIPRGSLAETVPLPNPGDVIAVRGGGCDYSKIDGGLTPEWVIQEDAIVLRSAVVRYCNHLEAFESAGAEKGEQR